jgi:hypothetical protein
MIYANRRSSAMMFGSGQRIGAELSHRAPIVMLVSSPQALSA